MSGSGNIRFSELFADTVKKHGMGWARDFYCWTHGMAEWEFNFWVYAVFKR